MMASPMEAATGSSQWAQLPDDILDMITDRLDQVIDYVRFGAACKPWLSFSHKSYKWKPLLHANNQQLPLLVVPTQGEVCGLYNITKGTVHQQIQLQLPYKRCCGSSHGWLFFVDNKSTLELVLINPFLCESVIKLPPIEFDPIDEVMEMDEYGVCKAILSKDPSTSPDDFQVMAIYGFFHKLAHYKSGDKFWTYQTMEKKQHFADVIFYKGGIYAANFYDWIVKVIIIRFKRSAGGNCSPCYLRFKTISKKFSTCLLGKYCGNAYLVETSKGDLLVVRRYYYDFDYNEARNGGDQDFDYNEEIEFDRGKTEEEPYGNSPPFCKGFGVYRLNCSGRRKQLMETLEGETLFLGDNYFISISASKCIGLAPDSIYYTDHNIGIYPCNIKFGSRDIGIFNVRDGGFGKHFVPNFSVGGMPPPIFVVPRYRCNAKRITS